MKSSEVVFSSVPVMTGAGCYNGYSALQAASAHLATDLLADAARLIPLTGQTNSFVIADYGCSEGKNSIEATRFAASILHDRLPEGSILIIHIDQPENDFSTLFGLLGNSAAIYKDSYTYDLAAGRNFYEKLLPAGFVNLGWSAHAVHWLSHAPQLRATSFWSLWLLDRHVQIVSTQAAADWRQFLLRRAQEFAAGGRLLIVTPVKDINGVLGVEGIMRLVDQALSEMVADSSIDLSERERMLLPTYYRTEAEFREPFSDPIVGSLLSLEKLDVIIQSDPFDVGPHRNISEAARAIAGFLRAFTEVFFKTCLKFEHTVSSHDLADQFFSRVEALARGMKLETAPRIAFLTIRRTDVALAEVGQDD